MTGELQEALRVLFTLGQVVELRGIAEEGTASGYFNDFGKLASQAEALDVLPGMQGIYVTLNEVNPALLSRRANRVKTRLGRKDATTADADIIRRRWFPVDIDPVRPSGVSSTDEEHQAALDTAGRVAAHLADRGWPSPLVADSGNGAHLLYRIDLPNDDEIRELVKKCLEVLSFLFSDDRMTVDTANHNAARIWKLYGTLTRKGDHTADRPHRRSRLVAVPDGIEYVRDDLLAALASSLPVSSPAPKAGRTIDLNAWLRDQGIGVRSEKPYLGGTIYILDACPFSESHRDGAFAIQFSNGAVHAGCHHSSCGGGKQRWKELRERYETGRPAGKRPTNAGRRAEPEQRESPSSVSSDYRTIAREILVHGDPMAVMLDAFAKEHVGDEVLARCLIASMASQAVRNSDGLHVSVTGESGKGKTHAYHKMLRQVPDRYKIRGTLSNKALYYMDNLAPRSVLMSDDVEMSDGIQEILKAATSNFDEPITHTTVTKDLTCRVCTIPERCVWWIAKKEGTGDDQVQNRMLTCWIDESAEQDERVLSIKQMRESREPDELPHETPELLTARALWECLQEQMVWVVIPFSGRVRFRSIQNRRNPDMLFDLVKSQALIHILQRRQKTAGDGTLIIYATEEDFTAANEIFTAISGTSGGQESKLTRKEAELIEAIRTADRAEFTIPELQEMTGWSYTNVYRTLKGFESRGKSYTGLLEKCPAISFTDRTVTSTDSAGNIIRRRTDAFAWNRGIYDGWSSGGPCWLDPDPGDGDDSLPALQQVSSTFPAPAANQNGAFPDSGSSRIPENNNNSVQGDADLQQKESAATREGPGTCVSSSIQNAENAAIQDQNPRILPESRSHASQRGPFSSSTGTQPAANDEHQGPDPGIRARDYKLLDIPEPTPCSVCGHRWSHYVEKLTPERRKRPDPLAARRVCTACYLAAKEEAQKAAVVLPGTIDVSRLERVKVSVGRCSVCDLEAATYIDRGSDVKLCEFCYQRVVQPVDQGEVVG